MQEIMLLKGLRPQIRLYVGAADATLNQGMGPDPKELLL